MGGLFFNHDEPAAPEGAPPRRISNKNFKQPTRPTVPLKRPGGGGSIVEKPIFMTWELSHLSIPVSTEQNSFRAEVCKKHFKRFSSLSQKSFLDLDNRRIPFFLDGFLELLDNVCHDPGVCGNFCCTSFKQQGRVDDPCTG